MFKMRLFAQGNPSPKWKPTKKIVPKTARTQLQMWATSIYPAHFVKLWWATIFLEVQAEMLGNHSGIEDRRGYPTNQFQLQR